MNSVAEGVFTRFSELHTAPVLFYVGYFLVALILFTYLYLRVWYFARRRILKQMITTQYEPPFGLNPAELRYLFNGRLGREAFGGLLVNMAQRGVIHFRKHEGQKIVLPGPKYEGKLKIYEKHILDVLDEHKSVAVSQLLLGYETIFQREHRKSSFAQQVHYELSKGRHVSSINIFSRFISFIKSLCLVLALFVWIPLVLSWLRFSLVVGSSDLSSLADMLDNLVMATLLATVPIGLVVVLLNRFQNKVIGKRRALRLRPREIWSQVLGYKLFVHHIRSGKLQFDAKHIEKKATLASLPYAIALGEVKHWEELIS